MENSRCRRPTCRALPLLLAICLSGCTYVCHSYLTAEPMVAADGWRLFGDVCRSRGPSSPHPAGGGWPHWGSAPDDEYYLVLTPFLNDTSLWARCAVDAAGPVVMAAGREWHLEWARVEDVRQELRQPWMTPADSANAPPPTWIFPLATAPRREHGPRRFTSGKFRLPHPPPDSLEIRVELQVRDAQSGDLLRRIPARAWAIIDRHRRWGIQDAVES